ncbi:hypothetical protein HPB51_000946 [Rhipicephalus microplus]|uniref:Uncharacterized protein n=1 Tax=Rhipicephalus microplus TaxID=6941 RepID=A0A9J6DL21_RHIMP|nr:hypothetical protein HPB51_000946 [Rhipicephalus microplus]
MDEGSQAREGGGQTGAWPVHPGRSDLRAPPGEGGVLEFRKQARRRKLSSRVRSGGRDGGGASLPRQLPDSEVAAAALLNRRNPLHGSGRCAVRALPQGQDVLNEPVLHSVNDRLTELGINYKKRKRVLRDNEEARPGGRHLSEAYIVLVSTLRPHTGGR